MNSKIHLDYPVQHPLAGRERRKLLLFSGSVVAGLVVMVLGTVSMIGGLEADSGTMPIPAPTIAVRSLAPLPVPTVLAQASTTR